MAMLLVLGVLLCHYRAWLEGMWEQESVYGIEWEGWNAWEVNIEGGKVHGLLY